ncbi:hypothetical protein U1Q18_045275, partial [Sarracenia purpurea var. burkii]
KMNIAQGVSVNHDIACRVLEESHSNMTNQVGVSNVQVGVYEKQDVYSGRPICCKIGECFEPGLFGRRKGEAGWGDQEC